MLSVIERGVTIDTNVFEHLFYSLHNKDGHIDKLLRWLREENVTLLIDSRQRITSEYNHRLTNRIQQEDDTDGKVYLLRYWIRDATPKEVPVNGSDSLMTAIKKIIVEDTESTDRVFAYVALTQGGALISNDRGHIVDGPPSDSNDRRRGDRLVSSAKKLRRPTSKILTSQEAYDAIGEG